jgi:hypothetical protein
MRLIHCKQLQTKRCLWSFPMMLCTVALFTFLKFTTALHVYTNAPHEAIPTVGSVKDANKFLLEYLKLERLEPWQGSPVNQPFVGMNHRTLLVAAEEDDISSMITDNTLILTLTDNFDTALLPSSLAPHFMVSNPVTTATSSIASMLSSFRQHSQFSYSTIFNSSSAVFHNSFLQSEYSLFAAVHLQELSECRRLHGQESTEYKAITEPIRHFLHIAVMDPGSFRLAVVAYSDQDVTSDIVRRQLGAIQTQLPLPSRPLPQQPIEAISTCFTSQDACNNSTASCTGHGQCVEASKSGRTCFVCACAPTRSGEGNKAKTEIWVGEMCERKDVSGYGSIHCD